MLQEVLGFALIFVCVSYSTLAIIMISKFCIYGEHSATMIIMAIFMPAILAYMFWVATKTGSDGEKRKLILRIRLFITCIRNSPLIMDCFAETFVSERKEESPRSITRIMKYSLEQVFA